MSTPIPTTIREISGTRRYHNDTYRDEHAYTSACTAKATLLLRYPFWGFMGLDLVLVEISSPRVRTLCTDGYHIFYSATFINSLRQGEIEFAIAHEIYHCIFGHTGGVDKVNRRQADWNPELWNRACDFVINYDLKQAGVGEFITTIRILYDAKFAGMSAEDVYLDLVQNNDPMPDGQLLDTHIDVNVVPDEAGDAEQSGQSESCPDEAATGPNNIQITMTESQFAKEAARWTNTAHQAMAQSLNSSIGAGSIPAHLLRLIGELHKPKIHWTVALRKFAVAIRTTGYSFIRPDKRTFGNGSGITIPGFRRDDKKLTVAVAIDTSGSVNEEMLTKFLSELKGIMRSYKKYELHVFCFEGEVDPASYMVITNMTGSVQSNIIKYAGKVIGGGGTIYQSVWNFMKSKRLHPRGLVFFTDGYPHDTDWIQEGRYCPTIFVVVGNPEWKAPFGHTVVYKES